MASPDPDPTVFPETRIDPADLPAVRAAYASALFAGRIERAAELSAEITRLEQAPQTLQGVTTPGRLGV